MYCIPIHTNLIKEPCLDHSKLINCTKNIFNLIYLNANSVRFPPKWCRLIPENNRSVIYSKILLRENDLKPYFERSVSIDEQAIIKCSYLNETIKIDYLNLNSNLIHNILELEDVICKMDNAIMCGGVNLSNELLKYKTNTLFTDSIGQCRHISCLLVVNADLTNNNSFVQCKFCKIALIRCHRKKLRIKCTPVLKRVHLLCTPSKLDKLKLLRKRNKNVKQLNRRSEKQIHKLKNQLKVCETKCSNLDEVIVLQNLTSKNIPQNYQLVIKEIIATSKRKSPNGNRYTEDWIMLCMLLHIRSPAGYSFMQNNKLLPLPSIRRIREYLSMINTTCGFDKKFFEILKKHLDTKTDIQRHGILIFDEISLRESVTVNSRSLTYTGLIDFGEEDGEMKNLPKATDINSKATHGLVFMFQPISDTYTQPIGVFASKGPVNGLTLAKLIVKAVLLLEKAGAWVHGFVSDGAPTNRRVWSEFGISGKLGSTKTHIEHFADNSRKFFAFSDSPHLIKCVRNRLFNNRQLQVNINFFFVPKLSLRT